MMRNIELLVVALVVISTLTLSSCRVKGGTLVSPDYSSLTFDVREIEALIMTGKFDSINHRILVPVDTAYVVVVTDTNHSFENPRTLPRHNTNVWFFAVPREYVQNFDPEQNLNAPSLLALNVSSTEKKLERGSRKLTPCGTISTVKPVTRSSSTLYHVINDYGNLMLVESDTVLNPWAKIEGKDLAITRHGSPWKSASTINMKNRMLKYNECKLDSWVWVDK